VKIKKKSYGDKKECINKDNNKKKSKKQKCNEEQIATKETKEWMEKNKGEWKGMKKPKGKREGVKEMKWTMKRKWEAVRNERKEVDIEKEQKNELGDGRGWKKEGMK